MSSAFNPLCPQVLIILLTVYFQTNKRVNGYMNKQWFEDRSGKGEGEGTLTVTEEDITYLEVTCAWRKAEQY